MQLNVFFNLYVFFLCFFGIKKHSQNIRITPCLNSSSFQHIWLKRGRVICQVHELFPDSLERRKGKLQNGNRIWSYHCTGGMSGIIGKHLKSVTGNGLQNFDLLTFMNKAKSL